MTNDFNPAIFLFLPIVIVMFLFAGMRVHETWPGEASWEGRSVKLPGAGLPVTMQEMKSGYDHEQ